MRTRAIVNRHAAGGKVGETWSTLRRRIEARIGSIEATYTEPSAGATELTRHALHDGVEQILAVGGDGTLNEVVNGFFEDDAPINPEAVLALVMVGTGGDFRKTFGLGPDPRDFIDRLANGQVRTIDLGRLTFVDDEGHRCTRYFDNIASFGLSGSVDRTVNRMRIGKLLGGSLAFAGASFLAMLRHQNSLVRIQIDDDYDEVLPASIVAACNGQFFGGGMWIAPNARVDDGLFDIVMLRDLNLFDFLRRSGALYRGEHLNLPKTTVRRGRRLVATPVDASSVVLLDVDGEAPGRLPAVFEVVPGALRLRC